jgi:hypothetical protein
MSRIRRIAVLVGAVSLTLVAALGSGVGAGPVAAASADHHAAVIVSANGTVVRRLVTFTTDSVSGLEALRSAGFDPVVYGFTGLGAAVCAIPVPPQGPVVGCPADNSCLTCASPNFWAYFEAGSGSSTFQMSRAGASSTRVHDGDVEGWKWGSGDAPPYSSVASLMGPPASGPPASGGRQPTSPAGGSGGGSVTPPNSNAPPTTRTQPGVTVTSGTPGTVAVVTTAPTATSATTGSPVTSAAGTGAQVAGRRAARSTHGSGGGSAIGLIAFGLVAAGLAAAVLLARRARTRRV